MENCIIIFETNSSLEGGGSRSETVGVVTNTPRPINRALPSRGEFIPMKSGASERKCKHPSPDKSGTPLKGRAYPDEIGNVGTPNTTHVIPAKAGIQSCTQYALLPMLQLRNA